MLHTKIHLFTRLFMPAIMAGILTVAVAGYAAPISVTTTFVNVAPSFTAGPSDGNSIITTPTNVGSNVTFTATANDNNHDSYWLAICKTGGSITPSGAGGAPTCTAGSWCVSSSAVAYNTQNTCSYTAQQADSESSAWVAYVCDNRSPSLCSSSSSGSGDAGSPFFVNHPPVIGTVYAGPSYGSNSSVNPGNGTTGAVYFQAGVTDTDTSDTIDMFVCSNATTSFDASTGTCTGGATLCSVTGVASGQNAQCTDSDLAPIPTAHGSYNTKIYLRDNSSTKLANAVTNKTYSVTDTTPTIASFNYTGGYSTLSPVVGTSVNQVYNATVSDDNGYADITSVKGAIYVSPNSVTATGECTTDSENTCYDVATCSLSGGSGTNITASCGAAGNLITTWWNIYPSASWKAHMAAVSDLGTTSFATEGTFTVSTLNAVVITEGTIPYGTLAVGSTSNAQTTTINNGGNVITDALISGTDMTSGGNTISRSQQRWSPNSSWTWGSNDYALVQTASVGAAVNGCTDRSIAVTSNHSSYTNSAIYWKLQVPSVQATGTYTGTTTINATPNDCSGGV